jgi:processed acidic surface protein
LKRVLSAILAVTLVFGLMPFSAFAIEPTDQELQDYLAEIGLTAEQLETYLGETYDFSLEEFEDVEDLSGFLGPILNDENLQDILTEFELTEEELQNLLADNEATLDDYIFYEDLYYDVMDWTYVETSTPITDENLQQLLSDYEFASVEELEAFLNKYDDSIENYEFIEDLEMAIADAYFAEAEQELIALMESIGLTKEEAKKLENHFMTLIENQEEPEQFLTQLEAIAERLMAFPEFENADELTAEDIAEMLAIWNDLLNLFELKIDYYLVKDGKETPISFAALMELTDINGADLKINIYNKSGELLADMIITKEMFGSDFVKDTGSKMEETTETVKEVTEVAKKAPAAKKPAKVVKTVNGGKLPNTATDYASNALAGLAFIIIGAFLYRRVKVKGA